MGTKLEELIVNHQQELVKSLAQVKQLEDRVKELHVILITLQTVKKQEEDAQVESPEAG